MVFKNFQQTYIMIDLDMCQNDEQFIAMSLKGQVVKCVKISLFGASWWMNLLIHPCDHTHYYLLVILRAWMTYNHIFNIDFETTTHQNNIIVCQFANFTKLGLHMTKCIGFASNGTFVMIGKKGYINKIEENESLPNLQALCGT